MREIRTVSHINLGDNLYNIHLFRKIIDLYEGNIRIIHHLKERHIKEASNFIKGYEDKIILKGLSEYIANYIIPIEHSSIPGWFLSDEDLLQYFKTKNLDILLYGGDPDLLNTSFFDIALTRIFTHWCKLMNVENPIKSVDDTLLDMKELLLPNSLSNNYDLLLANSIPMSAQWSNNRDSFNYLIDRIDLNKVKVISLEPTGNKDIPSTMECGLNLMEVGNISINSKRIIGVHSSPYCVILNKYNHKKVEEFAVFQNWEQRFRYSNCNSVNYGSDEDFCNSYRLPINWCKI